MRIVLRPSHADDTGLDMAQISDDIHRAMRNIPNEVFGWDTLWWLSMYEQANNHSTRVHTLDVYVQLAEHPCFCDRLGRSVLRCVSCEARQAVDRERLTRALSRI